MKADELQIRLGRAIRHRRERAGYSQEAFSDHIGVHQTYYGAVERGRQNITLRRLQQIADGLETPVWRLLRDAETKPLAAYPEPRGPGGLLRRAHNRGPAGSPPDAARHHARGGLAVRHPHAWRGGVRPGPGGR